MGTKNTSLLRSTRLACINALGCRSMQPRLFTSSATLLNRSSSKTVPVFQPTSSPELDSLLKAMREKIFLPAYLSESQQNLIYKKKHKQELEAEPVIAKLGAEEFRLQHIDPLNDVPNSKESLLKVFKLIKENSDWEVVPGVLEGLNKAGLRTSWKHVTGRAMRLLGKAGRQDLLVESLRQASRTGLRLSHTQDAKEALHAVAIEAVESDWKAAETEKALKWSAQLLDLMEDPKHVNSVGTFDSRKRPDIIGIALRIAAVNAYKHQGGKDVDGRVEQLAKRVLNCFDNVPLYVNRLAKSGSKEARLYDFHNSRLATLSVLLDGMRVAQKVLGPSSYITKMLKDETPAMEKLVEESYQALSGTAWAAKKQRVGIALYEGMVSAKS